MSIHAGIRPSRHLLTLTKVALALGLLCPVGPSMVLAQETVAVGETDLETLQPGLDSITTEKVKETVSFLASDELAGRSTLSEGFEKAADHVAQRFQQAGLKPGAGDSYFHKTDIQVTRTPAQGIEFLADGKALEHYELLSGGQADLEGSYGWKTVGLRDDWQSDDAAIAVVTVDPDAEGRRWIAQLARLANKIRQGGGKAILVKVGSDNPLRATARQMQKPQLEDERMRFMIPVLLVPDQPLPEGKLQLTIPQQVRDTQIGRNVIGILPGSDPELADQFVLFTAHLDHLPPGESGEDRIFNGADDNATGVTATVCLAEAFGALKTPPARSVVFMTFWGEERGLLGSRAFAQDPSIDLEKVVANVNIEMIGRPEAGARNKVWVTGWEKSDLGALMVPGAGQVGVTVFEHPQYSSMLYRASDNYSFAQKGVIAHSFSAGSLHDDYHQPSDEWEKLNLDHMAGVIRGLFAGAYPIADGKVTPKSADQ